MTVVARRRQQRGFAIGNGGWGGTFLDPAAIPPPSAHNLSTAGVVVNERTVLSLMAVSSCIRVIGDTASGLDPHVYRQTGSRPDPQRDKEVDAPEVIVDPYADIDREDGDFRRVASLGLNGNMITHVVDRKGGKNGNPVLTEVLNPSLVKCELKKGMRVYTLGAGGKVIPTADIVHVPWIALGGGLVGLNPIELGVNGFGIPLAAEQYAARFYAQGIHPTGILSVEKPLRPGDAKRVEQDLLTRHGGLSQSHAPIVLDSGAKWTQISITPETAQLLQSRAFSRGEIAGFYGVPGNWIGDVSPNDQGGPWGKGLQEVVMGFAMVGLSGYTRRLDRADTRLLPPGYYVRRNVADLFKTNSQMLGTFIQMLRMASIATPNEGRALAGLPETDEPGADSIFSPINSAHADFSAAGGWGAETGLPGSMNPKGAPNGSLEGGGPALESGG
jgi:HK97 family phage portal protein